jgi:hypothetical protein
MGTVPVPPNFAAGEYPTAAKINLIQTALNFLLNPPRAQAYPSAAQSHTTTGNYQAIALDAEDIDSDGMHDPVTNNSRLTCQTPGKYEVSAQVTFQVNATGRRLARINMNGASLGGQTEVVPTTVAGSTVSIVIPAIEVVMNATDYLELVAFQSSGANLAYGVGKGTTWIRAKWCGQ